MKLLLKRAHAYLYIFSALIVYFLLWPFVYYFSRRPNGARAMNKIRQIWCFACSAFTGIFYRYTFEEPIDWNRPYIICANHTSNLDVNALSLLVKGDYCFIGKEELKKGIVTRLYMEHVDISVKRENLVSALKAMKKTAKK